MRHPYINASMKKQINMLVDNELPMPEREKLMQIAEKNPLVSEAINDQKSFLDFVRSNVKRSQVTNTEMDKIRDRVLNGH